MALKRRLHLFVSGLVQGVFYRDNTKSKASSLNLTGWVRNLLDGRVEVVAEGDEISLQELFDYCRDNPGQSRVDDVSVEWSEAKSEFKEFKVAG